MGAAMQFLEHYRERRVAFYADRTAKRRAEAEARVSPRNPTASQINLDCEREMYHRIVDWSVMPDFGADAQERMDNGNIAAAAVANDLRAMGYQVVETEGPMQPFRRAADGKVIYTGRLDFKLDFGGRKIPVEVKDANQNVFQRVEAFGDLARWWWTRKYQCQVLVYCLQNNEPEGLLLLTCQGRKKFLPVILEEHLELAEAALRAGEAVVAAVEAGTPPPFTKDPTVCRHCDFFGRACNPPVEYQGAAMLDSDGELHALLTERAEAEAAHRTYEAADKRAKEIIKATGVDMAICGDFAISIKEIHVKAEAKPRPARVDRRITIVRAEAAAAEEVA